MHSPGIYVAVVVDVVSLCGPFVSLVMWPHMSHQQRILGVAFLHFSTNIDYGFMQIEHVF